MELHLVLNLSIYLQNLGKSYHHRLDLMQLKKLHKGIDYSG